MLKKIFTFILFVFSNLSYAMGIQELYSLALLNDPEFQIALKEKDASDANLGIARSYLLPNINYTFNRFSNNFDQSLVDDPSGTNTTNNLSYFSTNNQISINQTLFNKSQFANFQKGIAQVALGNETYRTKSFNLADRLSDAFFDVLLSQDQINFSNSQIRALTEQLKMNKGLFKYDQGTKTDILETESRLELAKTTYLHAQNTLLVNYRKLASIVGLSIEDLKREISPIQNNFDFFQVTNLSTKYFEENAEESNPDIQVAKKGIEISHQELNSKKGAFYPSLSLQGSFGTNQSQYVTQFNQQYRGTSIGVVLNVPIFTGGYNYFNMKQASANLEAATANYNFAREKKSIEIVNQLTTLESLKSQIISLSKAQKSTEFLIEATKKSFVAGYKTNIDILNAEQTLFQTQKDLAQSKYDYLKTYLKLQLAAGLFNQDVMADIDNRLLKNTRAN
jgi:protease secretion system outer membrane protein